RPRSAARTPASGPRSTAGARPPPRMTGPAGRPRGEGSPSTAWGRACSSSRACRPRPWTRCGPQAGAARCYTDAARMPTAPSKDLRRVPNPHPDRDYEVDHVVPEFTCVCPMTGQPDFATIRIRYVPDRWLVELKSLKLYMWAYREEGAFHEDVTNRILEDLVEALAPRRLEVVGDWNVRGGIKTVVTVRYEKPGPARRRRQAAGRTPGNRSGR